MPAPGQSTFDGNPKANPPTTIGYRPGLSDFNGASCIDVPATPPSPPTQPTADCWNTCGNQHVSAGKMIAVANVAVNAGGSPSVQSWATAANLIQTSPFTLTRVSAGVYQITWPPSTFPLTGWPKAYLNTQSTSAGGISAFYITNGVQVNTFLAGAAADANFNVDLY
jgi:hypothetical protein